MNKTKITRFIEKYFLGGLVENALWDVKNNVLTTRVDGDGTSFKAMVAMKDFDVEDCQLPVYDTDKLTKLFSVLESDVTLKVQKMDDTPIAVNAKDKDTTITFNLADKDIIPVSGPLKVEPEWTGEFKMDTSAANKFINGCGALSDSVHFTFITTDSVQIVLNYEKNRNVDKVSIPMTTISNDGVDELSFASQHLRNMLVANKDSESINIKVSNDGLMEVKCAGSDFQSTYYLLPLDK
jgi:predicted DNA binding CopG/RHH family protein